MDTNLILDYNRWAARGYLTALTCPIDDLDLFPTMEVDHLLLHCPRCNYKKELGGGEYKALERKVAMAKYLFNMKE